MTTEKQLVTNLQNAQLSTGPTTTCGKAIVATNAIKHGIFTKDLIISSEIGQENGDEYQALLDNLIECLLPCNQMESLLVEKITIDFWRLRRTLRFETGSITNHIATLVNKSYSYGSNDRNNHAIDKDILSNRQAIEWNAQYIEYLAQGKVTFDEPVWKEGAFESDIIDNLYNIAKSINDLSERDRKLIYAPDCLKLNELHAILQKHGYSEPKSISAKLVAICTRQNKRLKEENEKLSQQKTSNEAADKLTYMLGMVPAAENTDKISSSMSVPCKNQSFKISSC